jgi:hypothetical protein
METNLRKYRIICRGAKKQKEEYIKFSGLTAGMVNALSRVVKQ